MQPQDSTDLRNLLVLVGDGFELAEAGERFRGYLRLRLATERAARMRDRHVPGADELSTVCEEAMRRFTRQFGDPTRRPADAQSPEGPRLESRQSDVTIEEIRIRMQVLGSENADHRRTGEDVGRSLDALVSGLDQMRKRLEEVPFRNCPELPDLPKQG